MCDYFIRKWSDRTGTNGFRLKEVKFILNIEKKFLAMRVGRPWHRVPRQSVAAPSLEVSKARLEGALSDLG